ncbi:TIGR04388 family protein [Leptospira kanakyensis]|uniref:TIGR04388 family protein n=1 Tax=Leptospira kanakyensis TaxID=2484968 RepID=UPI00223E5726|nr:TIGR04388 family protein [Leptospira kanakyensis]MCW7481130.1 TIGR04388 family protein [Leptospira kanakyensis]
MYFKPSSHRISIVLVSSLFLFFASRSFGQSLSETWNVPVYQSSDYSEFYGQMYFSNSMEEWDARVEQVLTFSINQWLENADRMVGLLLSEESGEDAFVSNVGYLDERMRSLYSEVSVLYSEWERELLSDYFDNRNAFLDKLETGKVDSMYFQRIGQESLYEEYTEEERSLIENQNRILESAKEWEFEWNRTKQEGLDSFATAFSDLQTDYDAYILSLHETDLRFSENLNAINSYKETIKSALSGMVSQLKMGLDSSCEVQSGCQYKNFDGSYNEAGKIFSKFINDLSDELSESSIDPNSLFTSISTKIKNFLSEESNKAYSEHTMYQGRVYTYQTGLQINLNQSTSNFDLGAAEWRIRNQSYYDITSDMKYENWLSGGLGEVGNFSKIQDEEMRGIFQSIHHGDYGRLTSIINSKLGDGRRVQSLITANLYTDAYHFINNEKIAGFYVPFEEAHHTQGNLMLDGHNKYGYWIADRFITILTPGRHSFQMGAIGYSVLYEMFDETSLKTSLYWKENSSQLGGQYQYFQDTLLPAVSHWESKVKEYADTYEDWKGNRENLISEATAKLESNRQELERSKEEWLHRLEEEKREGIKSWANLYETGEKKDMVSPNITSWTPNKEIEGINRTKLAEYQTLASSNEVTSGVQVGGVGLLEEFQRTILGVDQYASVIQMNSELEAFQRSEQQKLINQLIYGINADTIRERKLTKEENILIGNYDVSLLSKEELSRFGSCYENPDTANCKSLLKKEFEASINSDTGILTLKREIHSGLLGNKDGEGEYTAAKTEEVRHINLSSITKVHSPDQKGFFTVWSEEDWDSLYQSKSKIVENFRTNSLQKDKNAIGSNIKSIIETDNRNQELFVVRKVEKEKTDSLIQELALAYFTGGAAGVRASLKGKVEDHINTELAKAWITATGGSQQDLQRVSMIMDFMRGKVETKKIESRSNFVSLSNPFQGIENIVRNSVGGYVDFFNNATGGLSGALLTNAMLPVVALGNAVIGSDQMDVLLERKNAQSNRIKEIKANEVSLAKSAASLAIAGATGLPIEIVSAGVSDFASARDAKNARRAITKNPIIDGTSQVFGVAGGIVKTAVIATGVTQGEFRKSVSQANQLASGGSLRQSSAALASLGLSEQMYGMKATGTSFTSELLNIKDKDRVIEELGKRALANQMAANLGIDPKIALGFINKGYGDYKTRESDKKAQANAIEQVAVMIATTAITMGTGVALNAMVASANSTISAIGSAIANFGNTVGNAVGSILGSTAQATTTMVTNVTTGALEVSKTAINAISAMANATVQGVVGSKNGIEGALAGIANGLLGGVTQAMGPIQSGMLKGITPGIGVTYHPKNGWGGSIGIGNTTSNASISFSQRGDTTIQGSYSLGKSGIQLAGDATTNGATNLGFNYNPTGNGPRKDWNFSLMYDFAGTGLSGSVGYTDPRSTLGVTSTFNREGMSTSAEFTGVSIATNGPNGFQMDEMNFAELNINAAQDKTSNDQNPNQLSENAGPEDDADLNRGLADAGKALSGLFFGGMAIVRGLYGGGQASAADGSTTPTANAGETAILERNRRREEEAGDVADSQDLDRTNDNLDSDLANSQDTLTFAKAIDLMNPDSTDPVEIGGVDMPAREFTIEGNYNLSQPVKDGILNILDGFIPNLSLPNLGIPDNIISDIASLLSGEGLSTPMAGPKDIPGWLRAFGPIIGFPFSFADNGNGNNNNDSLIKKPGEKLSAPMEPKSEDYQKLKTKVLDRYFGQDGGTEPAKKFVDDLLKDSNLSDADREYLKGFTESLYNIPKNEYSKFKKNYYENGKMPDTYKPKVGFAPLLPGAKQLVLGETTEPIPSGGRDRVYENGVVIRERDIVLDRDQLVKEADEMRKHWEKDHPGSIKYPEVTSDMAIGNDSRVAHMIPYSGVDANGNVLWTSYNTHPEDFTHRYTTKEMADFAVSFASNWNQFQKASNGTAVPLSWNDFSMPGNGQSLLHHDKGRFPFDMMIPSKNGETLQYFDDRKDSNSSPTYNGEVVNLNPNYDREKTINMIKILGESAPPGKKVHVYFNDPVIIKYFEGTNIEVEFATKHDNHIDVRLK